MTQSMPGVRARVRDTLAPGRHCQRPMLAPSARPKAFFSALADCMAVIVAVAVVVVDMSRFRPCAVVVGGLPNVRVELLRCRGRRGTIELLEAGSLVWPVVAAKAVAVAVAVEVVVEEVVVVIVRAWRLQWTRREAPRKRGGGIRPDIYI